VTKKTWFSDVDTWRETPLTQKIFFNQKNKFSKILVEFLLTKLKSGVFGGLPEKQVEKAFKSLSFAFPSIQRFKVAFHKTSYEFWETLTIVS
jgi:hypothetical protein